MIGDEAALYAQHHRRLVRVVGDEDACQHAWQQLVIQQPERCEGLFGWLVTVARRFLWSQSRWGANGAKRRVELPLFDFSERLAYQPSDAGAEVEAALIRLREASLGDQRAFILHLTGFSHDEIAERFQTTRMASIRRVGRAREIVRAAA